ncbi:MAG TPA: CBS domain-containing protein [Thermodesulfovibrionales bacterium]|nr:CBS domain-containing protein [Thermodesulfovibrionales bacterium]
MEIITSHTNADFDALASMVAAKKIYPEAVMVFPGSQEKKVRDFISAFHPVDIYRIRDIDMSKVKRLIIVDTKSQERIGPFSELVSKKSGIEIHLYDHHPGTANDIHGSLEMTENVGATATIFTEILKSKKVPLTPMEATVLCLGIYEETGSLLFRSTTERDILAVAYLLKRGASLKIVSRFIRTELSREELDLLNELLQSSDDIEINGIRIKIAKASREEYPGDAAHMAHRMMDMGDIDGVVVLLGMQGKIVIVGRSRVPELNISEVMKRFGGGGHPSAASATVVEVPLEVVEEEVRAMLASSIRQGKTARDVMTTPVITISWNNTVKDAESIMTRYGVNVLPVVADGRYKGIISREIVEKAIFHGFGKSKIADFTTTDAQTVNHDTPVRDIERMMIEQNQRFMPVLEGETILGAITRTDILRVLYEDILKRSRLGSPAEEKPSMGRNLGTWLREKFPPPVSALLKNAGEVADSLGYKAYLVGGSVRDLLRGQENLDIDIVIEGDGMQFAREFGQRLAAKVRTHERFGTAQVLTDDLKLDVATARTEYYESPAALPKVETSSIKKDLYRRDFTINTLAVVLNPRDFGVLIDFFGGQRDLREKTIRVLHNLSFIEDPTRAFRAVRFSERFGFKLSKHTENLIKSALRMNLFDKLSGSRLYEELLLTFDETEPVKAIKRLSAYGLLKVIHLNLVFGEKIEAILQSVHDTLSWFNLLFLEEKPVKGSIYLMTLLSVLSAEERQTAFVRLSMPSKIKEIINKGIMNAHELIGLLPLRDNAKIYRAIRHLDIEAILFAMAIASNENKKKEISRYLLELRQVKPQTTGADLKDMGITPGPVYSEILNALLDERLRGRLKTRVDELAFIKEEFKP